MVPKLGIVDLPANLHDVLAAEGIDPQDIQVADAPYYPKIAWEELCSLTTQDAKTMASPIIVVQAISDQPDAQAEFDGYVGLVRLEFVTEYGDRFSVTHARNYASTGGFLPLTEWVRSKQVPFVCRLGRVETNRVGRHVIKPLPIKIEVI